MVEGELAGRGNQPAPVYEKYTCLFPGLPVHVANLMPYEFSWIHD